MFRSQKAQNYLQVVLNTTYTGRCCTPTAIGDLCYGRLVILAERRIQRRDWEQVPPCGLHQSGRVDAGYGERRKETDVYDIMNNRDKPLGEKTLCCANCGYINLPFSAHLVVGTYSSNARVAATQFANFNNLCATQQL